MRKAMVIMACLFLASCAGTLADISWDEIDQTECGNLDEIKLTSPTNRNAIIAHAYIDTPSEVLSKIEYFIQTEGFDPILFEIYLAFKLNRDLDDGSILLLLLEYASNDTDNAIPLYFLSYYYACMQNYHESLRYLRQGNLRKQCQLYIQEKKQILFDYVLAKTNNECAAYSSQFFVHNPDIYMVLRNLSRKLLSNNISELEADELAEIGRKFEQNNIDVIDKLFGLAMQMTCIEQGVDNKSYEFLDKKYEYYKSLSHRAYDQRGKERLMVYLETAFEHGEVYALEQLGPP